MTFLCSYERKVKSKGLDAAPTSEIYCCMGRRASLVWTPNAVSQEESIIDNKSRHPQLAESLYTESVNLSEFPSKFGYPDERIIMRLWKFVLMDSWNTLSTYKLNDCHPIMSISIRNIHSLFIARLSTISRTLSTDLISKCCWIWRLESCLLVVPPSWSV